MPPFLMDFNSFLFLFFVASEVNVEGEKLNTRNDFGIQMDAKMLKNRNSKMLIM